MHDTHKHHTHGLGHTHDHEHEHESQVEELRKLHAMLEHWIEHSDGHAESYREWAQKAGIAGEHEVAREIHLALDENELLTGHLKRARAIVGAKLVLKK